MDRTTVILWSLIFLFISMNSLPGQCDLGKNYAVFFGVADYDANSGWPDLHYPVDDIESLARLLHDYFAFDTLLLRNPGRSEIWDQLYHLKNKNDWSPNDQLLLFFSGHGEDGFFIPKDGRRGREQNTAISFDKNFRDFLNDIPCNHQLVIIDACYSGSFFKAEFRSNSNGDGWKKELMEDQSDKNLQILCSHQSRKTRLAMTSAASSNRSPDQSQLVKSFKNMLLDWQARDEILYTGAIYLQLMKENSTPLFDEFHFTNDPGASFVFLPPKIRQFYEQSSPCPIDPVVCAPEERECVWCPKDPANQIYQVLQINGKLWMTENLSFPNYGRSDCQNCSQYGRLYTWEQARDACRALGDGWRLPTVKEWEDLSIAKGSGFGTMGIGHTGEGDYKASFQKMMESEWKPVLAGWNDGKKLRDQQKEGIYWTSELVNQGFDAYVFSFSKFGVIETVRSKEAALSCRCLKD